MLPFTAALAPYSGGFFIVMDLGGERMIPAYSEADSRVKPISPALYARGSTEDNVRREGNAGEIDVVDGQLRLRASHVLIPGGRQPT